MSRKISQLNEATDVLDTDVLAVVNEGETKKATKENFLKELVEALGGKVGQLEFTSHTQNSSIHFTQGQIAITESQISNLDKYTQAQTNTLLSAKAASSHTHAWGALTGTLSNQTDLQTALNAKANDSTVVKLAGTQTITGAKTLSTDFTLSKAIAATSGSPLVNSPYLYLDGKGWDTAGAGASRDLSVRIRNTPAASEVSYPSSKFVIEAYSPVWSADWEEIFSVGPKANSHLTARVGISPNTSAGHGGYMDVYYEGSFSFKDKAGDPSPMSALSFGKGSGQGYEQYFVYGYSPEIRTHFGSKILLSSGRPFWRYGDNVGSGYGEYVQSDLPVGIGTATTPSATLHIKRSASSVEPLLVQTETGVNLMRIRGTAGDNLMEFRTATNVLAFVLAENGAPSSFGGFTVQGSSGDPITRFKTSTGTEAVRISEGGSLGIATASPTALLDINSDVLRLRTAKTPASSGASGNQGDIAWDSTYLYIATATNNWKRIALTTF